MSQEVIVVTDGDYSDYRIIGAFSSQELADKHVALYGGTIETYETDDDSIYHGLKGRAEFTIAMSEDGTVTPMYARRDDSSGEIPTKDNRLPRWYFASGRMVCCALAKSKEHAVKIANEVRTQLIANNAWGLESR